MIHGLQTKGIFCCHCTVEPEVIRVGILWLRDANLLGQIVSLVQSESSEGDRFLVLIPDALPFPACDVELKRVASV